MRRRPRTEPRLLSIALGGACACALVLSYRYYSRASAQARAASAVHAATLLKARRLAELSTDRAVVADRPRPEPDLVARLQERLHASGLDPVCLTQVSVSEPRSASGDGPGSNGSSLQRQEATLTLDAVRPGDLARFLASWREGEPHWIPKTVRLQRSSDRRPSGAATDGSTPKGDARYSVILVLDNVFAAPLVAASRKEGTR